MPTCLDEVHAYLAMIAAWALGSPIRYYSGSEVQYGAKALLRSQSKDFKIPWCSIAGNVCEKIDFVRFRKHIFFCNIFYVHVIS